MKKISLLALIFFAMHLAFGAKIATHDSATGEKGYGVLSFFLTPFACCQGKSLDAQYRAGARYFDIRVRKTNRGWICAHGPWETKRSAEDILGQLSGYGDALARIWYEGTAPANFLEQVEDWRDKFKGLDIVEIGQKSPWLTLRTYRVVPLRINFRMLNFSTWHTYIPIPWMWSKLSRRKLAYNDEIYTMEDWL